MPWGWSCPKGCVRSHTFPRGSADPVAPLHIALRAIAFLTCAGAPGAGRLHRVGIDHCFTFGWIGPPPRLLRSRRSACSGPPNASAPGSRPRSAASCAASIICGTRSPQINAWVCVGTRKFCSRFRQRVGQSRQRTHQPSTRIRGPSGTVRFGDVPAVVRPLHPDEIVAAHEQRVGHRNLCPRRSVEDVVIAHDGVAQRGGERGRECPSYRSGSFGGFVDHGAEVQLPFLVDVFVHVIAEGDRIFLGPPTWNCAATGYRRRARPCGRRAAHSASLPSRRPPIVGQFEDQIGGQQLLGFEDIAAHPVTRAARASDWSDGSAAGEQSQQAILQGPGQAAVGAALTSGVGGRVRPASKRSRSFFNVGEGRGPAPPASPSALLAGMLPWRQKICQIAGETLHGPDGVLAERGHSRIRSTFSAAASSHSTTVLSLRWGASAKIEYSVPE